MPSLCRIRSLACKRLREKLRTDSTVEGHRAAEFYHSPEWNTVRPPLCSLSETDAETLKSELRQLGFSMTATQSASGDSDRDG